MTLTERESPRTGQLPTPADAQAGQPRSTDQMPTAVETEKATKGVAAIIAVLVVSAFMMILNETVLSIALPQLMSDFAVAETTAQWLTTGFMLTMAIVIPTTGFLIQRLTTRTLFAIAIGSFIVGTVLAAVAPTFEVMLAARVIQAIGTAIILPLLMTTTLTSVPVQHRGTVMGLNSIVISVAPAIGPTVAGLVIGAWGWRWLFGIMLVIAAIALVVGLFVIRTTGDVVKARLDVLSVIVSAVGFGALVYGLSTLAEVFAGNFVPLIALVAGVAVIAYFVGRQRQLEQRGGSPLLSMQPFRVRNFTVSVVIVMMAMAMMLGTVIVLPIYLQVARGVSVLDTGLLMLAGGLIQGIVSPLSGKLYDRVGPRPLVIPGTVLLTLGLVLLSTVGAATPLLVIVAYHVVFGLGMSLIMTPLMTVALGSLPRRLYAHGSAIMNTLQQLAGAAGTAVFIAALAVGSAMAAAGPAAGEAMIVGTRTAFSVGIVLGLVAIVSAPFVRRITGDPDAADAKIADSQAADAAPATVAAA